MNNIILIGFMGCGKTSVGIRLSYQLRRAFLDTDKLIERAQGKEISEIFAEVGEAGFRDMETQLLRDMIGTEQGKIISTGGGLPIREQNRKLLKELGTVIYLKLTPETVYERLKEDTKRPLLQCADPLQRIRTLMAEREAAYAEAADMTLLVDTKDFDTIIKEIEESMG